MLRIGKYCQLLVYENKDRQVNVVLYYHVHSKSIDVLELRFHEKKVGCILSKTTIASYDRVFYTHR